MKDKESFINLRNKSNPDYELWNQRNDDIENNYYKAYDKRYGQVYKTQMLWSAKEYTPDVINTIKKLKKKIIF